MEGAPTSQPQAPQPVQPGQGQPTVMKPHRGATVLVLGILGIVLCFICGIIAWIMGQGDLKEMSQGQRDPEGYGLTRAGMICGIVGTGLAVVGLLWWIIAMAIFGTSFLGALNGCY
jgi:hypothetical protein